MNDIGMNENKRTARLQELRTEQRLKTSKAMSSKKPTVKNREDIQLELLVQMLKEKITDGQLLRRLRKDILGLSQDQFAKMTKVSRKTISDIEGDKGSPSRQLLNKVFRPFGLRSGILPISENMTEKLILKFQTDLDSNV